MRRERETIGKAEGKILQAASLCCGIPRREWQDGAAYPLCHLTHCDAASLFAMMPHRIDRNVAAGVENGQRKRCHPRSRRARMVNILIRRDGFANQVDLAGAVAHDI